ncbi:MAG: PAS domain-containing protein [Desulfobacter sp.]|nr:MAG: PAS domain-containing protein [Desulfobacter sp.]
MDMSNNIPKDHVNETFPLNIAIVGGGRTCRFFLELIHNDPFPFFDIKILGVCDKNAGAEGMLLAEEMGIYTTGNLHDLLNIERLDSVLELTGRKKVLHEIIRLKPRGVGVLEYNISRILRNLLDTSRRLESTEQKLVAEKDFSNLLIQQSTAAIVIINTDFIILDANDAYLNTVKRPKDKVIGAHCYEISHGINTPCSSAFPGVKCPMLETLRTGKNAHVIHDHPGPDGHRVYCNLTTYPVRNANGDVIQVIEFWRDVTAEFSDRWNEREKKLKSNIQKMIQEDRMISLGKLAASCAHEINNPIQGLLTFCDYMLDTLNEGRPGDGQLKKFKDHLSLMSKELERCGNIVSGLLSFSRESAVEFSHLDLNEVLNSVLSLTRHKLELRNIKLTTGLYPAPILLEGDINQLQQCFLNLVFNAIESMPEGGDLIVTSRIDKEFGNACVEIRDTGYGIPEKVRDNLFDPFFTTKDVGKGTGLGLSIVYGVVKNHRGKIKIDSREKKGAAFTITFPMVSPAAPDANGG